MVHVKMYTLRVYNKKVNLTTEIESVGVRKSVICIGTFQNLKMLKIRNVHWNYLKRTKLPTHAIKTSNTVNIITNLTTQICYNFKIICNIL